MKLLSWLVRIRYGFFACKEGSHSLLPSGGTSATNRRRANTFFFWTEIRS